MLGADYIERGVKSDRRAADLAQRAQYDAAVSHVADGVDRIRKEFTGRVSQGAEADMQALRRALDGSVGAYTSPLQRFMVDRVGYKFTGLDEALKHLDVDPEKIPVKGRDGYAYSAREWVRKLKERVEGDYGFKISLHTGFNMATRYVVPVMGGEKPAYRIEIEYELDGQTRRADIDKKGQTYSREEVIAYFDDKLKKHIGERRTVGHIAKRVLFSAAAVGAVYLAGDKAVDIATDPATAKYIAGFTQDGPR